MGAEYNFADPKYEQLANQLIAADPVNLGHIETEAIAFLVKEEKKPRRAMNITAIKEPFVMLCRKLYIVEISEELCNGMTQEQYELTMYKTLRHISEEMGRLNHPNVREFSDIIEMFGWDWQENPNIPSIFDVLNGTVASVV